MSGRHRADHERAFVLHTYPYSETSLLVDAYTRTFGRVALLAKGARRPRAALRGLLIAFQPVALSWTGKGEVRTLLRGEWLGGFPLPRGEALLCGFYVNELLMRTLARDDAHEALFDRYEEAIRRLAEGGAPAPSLRWFERRLLQELGYAMTLLQTADGDPIDPHALYTYKPERGALLARWADAQEGAVHGQTLLDLARDDFTDPRTQQEAKHLMRRLINHRLEHRPLLSRQVFRDLQNS
jgi:DNA repair protein RecO (recombination protein O)